MFLVPLINTYNEKNFILLKNQMNRAPVNEVENVELIQLFLNNLIGIILILLINICIFMIFYLFINSLLICIIFNIFSAIDNYIQQQKINVNEKLDKQAPKKQCRKRQIDTYEYQQSNRYNIRFYLLIYVFYDCLFINIHYV